MTKKRGQDRIEKVLKKRRSTLEQGSTLETTSYSSLTKDTNILNDSLLNLYRQGTPTNDISSKLPVAEGSFHRELSGSEVKEGQNFKKLKSSKTATSSIKKMKRSDTSEWLAFFTKAGLLPNIAENYALIFSDNRMQLDTLMELSKEYLYDMGIRVVGDVLTILCFAKEFHTQIPKDKAIGNSAVLPCKGCMVGHHTRPPHFSPKESVVNPSEPVFAVKHSTLTYADVGGLDDVIKEVLLFKVRSHFNSVDLAVLGVPPVKGFLLHGPPGCGKTHFARATAGELGLPYIEVAVTELVCGISGESESKIRDLFDAAIKSAPCILFLDEIDAISPKRETSDRGMEKRMVSQLLCCFNELNEVSSDVIVIGATNRPDSIDPALRNGERFDKEFAIGLPNENSRLKILQVLCKKLKLHPAFNMQWLAQNTPGYAGADLKSLITAAVEVGITRIYKKYLYLEYTKSIEKNDDRVAGCSQFPNVEQNPDFELTPDLVQFGFKSGLGLPKTELSNIYFEQQDFQTAIKTYIPCSKREGFATIPDVKWDDIGALDDIQKELQSAILWPIKYRKLYEISYLSSTKGILLYGPKGCGKTLLAKAIANECSINFLSVKGPELLSMYLGESEKAVRQCFQRAKNSAPCIIFFDEIDALCPRRSSSNVNAAAERVVNQLLTEMDGMEERNQVFVMGATNRLEKIDSAMLRPGRLDKIIYVDIPSPAGRVDILKRITKNKTRPKIADDVDLETLGLDSRCENFSGADLAYLLREATSKAMAERLNEADPSLVEILEIKMKHFEQAFRNVQPSITKKEIKYFKRSQLRISKEVN